jgi:hypothetical protein
MANPLGDFFEWISGAGAIRDAGAQQQQGIANATKTITDGGKSAMELLAPYLQGGKEDYGNYRSKVNSGYYNTPFAGTFNPTQAPQAQNYEPTWNPQTQSYTNNRPAYQPQQRGPISQQALPQWNRPTPQPGPQAPVQQPTQQPPAIAEILKAILQKASAAGLQDGRNLMPTNPGGMNNGYSAPTDAHVPTPMNNQNPNNPWSQMGRNPTTMGLQDILRIMQMNKAGSGPTAPTGFGGKLPSPTIPMGFGGVR